MIVSNQREIHQRLKKYMPEPEPVFVQPEKIKVKPSRQQFHNRENGWENDI